MSAKRLLAVLFLFWILYVLAGCSESKKIAKAKSTLDKSPIESATYCAERFPVDSLMMFTEGPTVTDTIYVMQTEYYNVSCPESKTDTVITVRMNNQVKTITKQRTDTITIIKENTARYEAERLKKVQAQEQCDKWQGKAENRRKWNIWLIVALFGCMAWITRKIWLKLFIV